MTPAANLVAVPSRSSEEPSRRTPDLSRGFTDGLGERQVSVDAGTGLALELLRFHPEMAGVSEFEFALRDRARALTGLHHPSLGTLRGVDRIDGGQHLVLISRQTPGRRLADLLPKASGPVFALELLRQLTPALAALHQLGPNVAHGALSAERIVVTGEGRLVIVEHALASALEALNWPASRLSEELGLSAPNHREWTHFDSRADIIQLGLIALSLLVGRKLSATDCLDDAAQLLDEFAPEDASASARQLRRWLERALQIGSQTFASGPDALEALSELPVAVLPKPAPVVIPPPAPVLPPAPVVAVPQPVVAAVPAGPVPVAVVAPEPVAVATQIAAQPMSADVAATEAPALLAEAPTAPAARASTSSASTTDEFDTALSFVEAPRARRMTVAHLMAAFFALVAVVEGVAIYGLMTTPQGPIVVEMRPPASGGGPTPLAAPIAAPIVPAANSVAGAVGATGASAIGSGGLPGNGPATTPVASDGTLVYTAPALHEGTTPPPATPAVSGRVGGVKLNSPISLQVFENGTLVGTSDGPIAVGDGQHVLELVNEALGFRTKQTVNVRPGQLANVAVAIPNGRISINAVPWAEVLIGGKSVGETPIANMELPIGTHEIVFRHPQFGEQRQTAVIKVDGLTRIGAKYQQ